MEFKAKKQKPTHFISDGLIDSQLLYGSKHGLKFSYKLCIYEEKYYPNHNAFH
jgi:hypothetical protein